MKQRQFRWSIVPALGTVFFMLLTADYAFAKQPFTGVCPPFFIRDDAGSVINPVTGENADKPYSPRQTCGISGCHNYKKITQGYHFQQGKDEKPSEKLASLYQWVLSPGQYGGRW